MAIKLKRALPLAVGLAAVFGLVASGGGGVGASSATAHTVTLNCSSSYGGDQRTAYDASVQPGVIVPDALAGPTRP